MASIFTPTHRCNLCGAGWFLWSDGKSWTCLAPEPGSCCRDDIMGPSVKPIIDETVNDPVNDPVMVKSKSEKSADREYL